MDDGADLVSALHMIALNRLDDLAPPVRKWVETLSVPNGRRWWRASSARLKRRRPRHPLKAMAKDGVLQFP